MLPDDTNKASFTTSFTAKIPGIYSVVVTFTTGTLDPYKVGVGLSSTFHLNLSRVVTHNTP